MDIIVIDGSYGEGGGQILRTSLSLSIITGKPFEIVNIRAGRREPGLRPQHLMSVQAATQISSAHVEGAELGSLRLRFIPNGVKSGWYELDVGTAGATSLIIQTVFFPLALKGKSISVITVRGGTHVPWSPPYEFLKEGWLVFMRRIGFRAEMELKRAGFYPRGGGEVTATIWPVDTLLPLESRERGSLVRVFGISAVGGLPREVAERGKNRAIQILGENGIPNQIETGELQSYGRGAIVFLKAVFEKTIVCYSALGERGKRMEEVSEEACKRLLGFLKTDATVDEHTADQLILPLALARGRSYFRVPEVTGHVKTNAEIVGRFLDDVGIRFEGNGISIEGIGKTSIE